MLLLSAITFFCISNRLTVEQTLEVNLSDPKVRTWLVREILEVLNHGNISYP